MSQTLRYSLLLAAVGLLLFVPFLGGVRLFDWDEVNFAEAAREMLVLNNFGSVHVDFKPFYEKPPFFFWCQALCMKLFGVGEFAARLPNALLGAFVLGYVYRLGRKLHDHRFGLLWAGAWLGSVTPHLYYRSGIIDPFFNFFIFVGLLHLIFASWTRHDGSGHDRAGDVSQRSGLAGIDFSRNPWTHLLWGGFVLGVAILTKGPVAYLLVALTAGVYWALGRFRWFVTPAQWLAYTAAASVVSLIWFGLETWANGPTFVREFITYNFRLFKQPDAGHGGFFGYHPVVLLVGCFPASVFALRAFGKQPVRSAVAGASAEQRDFRRWMLILFWVVVILFSIVKSKIVHYSSLCYYPVTYLGALTLWQIWNGDVQFRPWMRYALWFIGGAFILATIGLPIIAKNPELLRLFVADNDFARQNVEAPVRWTGWAVLPGVWLIGVLGWATYYFRRGRIERASAGLFGGMAVFVTLTLWFFIGRIEGYAQATAMQFFEQFQGRDVYVHPVAYRSYGAFFYTRKAPVTNPNAYDENWLLRGPIDKDAYFITKVDRTARLDSVAGLQRLGQRYGYVFYRRPKP